MNQKQNSNKTIALNRRATYDYFVEERFEAGIRLEGWEVKSLREGKVQLDQSYVIVKENQVFLLGGLITPLQTASTHIHPDPQRTRKLLMHRREIDKLTGSVERKGYTLIPLSLYWKGKNVKLEVGLAKGKKDHDKRASEKDRDWKRQKQRLSKDL